MHLASHRFFVSRVSYAALLPSALLLVACGSKYPQPVNPVTAASVEKKPAGIESAGLPYVILDARTGHQIATEEFWQRAASAQVVCLGEEHKNPHHHWAQLESVEQLLKQKAWTSPALGMEMFQRPFQGVLDDYANSRIDEAALISRSGWEERWSYDFGFYRPQMQRVIAVHGNLLALNAARELTKKVVRQGLESLLPDEKSQVPELKLDDAEHRAWFDGIMAEMSGDGGAHAVHGSAAAPAAPVVPTAPQSAPAMAMPSMDRVYTVQVMWDESMADGAARWISADRSRHLAILAGAGHCHDSAVVRRVKRRGISSTISIRPVLDMGDGELAAALAKPMNDYLFVMSIPKK
jgi:uncharacterized iron-regulated protein